MVIFRLTRGASFRPTWVKGWCVLTLCLLPVVLYGCRVEESREELLKDYYRCQDDSDCLDGWSCRRFFFMAQDAPKYCMKGCSGDEDCLGGQFCGDLANDGTGYCLTECRMGTSGMCPSGWTCMRDNVSLGRISGYCHPSKTCGENSDSCGNIFDVCLVDFLLGAASEFPIEFASGGSPCVTGDCPSTQCQSGYSCLFTELANPQDPGENPPPKVCAPKCGPGRSCPPGFRCLAEIVEEAEGVSLPEGDYSVCFPGLANLGYTCKGDHHCFLGRCVNHPVAQDRSYCAEPCTEDGKCRIPGTVCLDTDDNGLKNGDDFCFRLGILAECNTAGSTDDCEGDAVCRLFPEYGDQPICTYDCAEYRDGTCPAGTTCMPHSEPNQFACFYGSPGFPCADDNNCAATYLGESLVCGGAPGKGLCTTVCSDDGDCDWTSVSLYPAFCDERGDPKVCWPILYSCDTSTDQGRMLDCDPPLDCFTIDADLICSLGCDESHPADGQKTCPLGSGCIHLESSLFGFCVSGFPGVACSTGADCLTHLGNSCVSASGEGTLVDGLCSVGCATDADCHAHKDPWGSTDNLFCLLSLDGQGRDCMLNPSLHATFNENEGYQWTLCGAPGGRQASCAPGHICLRPPGQSTSIMNFCAKSCAGDGDCADLGAVCDGERCVGDDLSSASDNPRAGLLYGLGETCYDHRQCATGLCHLDEANGAGTDLETLWLNLNTGKGYCSKPCGSQGESCGGNEDDLDMNCGDGGVCVRSAQ